MWTCPGWMFVPRKPHPTGNEYHSICCGVSGIMYFCVLLALVKLASFGVYLSAVVKMRRYWPTYIDGSNIDAHFDFKEVGQTGLPGTLEGT